jgi:hypothetical protein
MAYTVNNSGFDRHKNRHNCSRLVRGQREFSHDIATSVFRDLSPTTNKHAATRRAAACFAVMHGIVMAGTKPAPGLPVRVASISTLMHQLDEYSNFDLR